VIRRSAALATFLVLAAAPAAPAVSLAVVDSAGYAAGSGAYLVGVARHDADDGRAPAGATRAAIDARLTAHVVRASRACGGKLAVAIPWTSFATPASAAVASQAVPAIDALARLCADADDAAATRALRELRVDYRADGGALRLEVLGGGVTMVLHLGATRVAPGIAPGVAPGIAR
jgi:hypothetical protein